MVLGSIRSCKHWHWAAYGKHPAVKDFFRIGQDLPLMESFSDWVEKGYKMLLSKRNVGHEHFSWCFWAKGSLKEVLICGLVRDSSDGLGRPYPLFIMGIGPLKGWEDHWDLLPFACEKTWNQIEYLSAQVFKDFRELEIEIQNIQPPYPDWSEFKTHRERSMEFEASSDHKTSSRDFKDLESQASNLSDKTDSIFYLDKKPFNSQFMLISYWHFLFKTHLNTIPNALFMGGTVEKAYMAFFKRPLMPADFNQLWSVSSP